METKPFHATQGGQSSTAIRIGAVAVAYFAVAALGRLPALAWDHTAVVWPAAGVALGALIIWGLHCWPGVWLGSFLFMLLGGGSTIASAGPFAVALVATGTALQAVLGALLARRFLRSPGPLSRERDVWRFLLFCGPVICVVSATVNFSAWYWLGQVPIGGLATGWVIWWAGESVGVLLVTPLIILYAPRSRILHRRTGGLNAVPLLVTATLLMGSQLWLQRTEQTAARQAVTAKMDEAFTAGTRQFSARLEALQSVEWLFSASEKVTRQEFATFAARAISGSAHQFIDRVSWIPRVTLAQRTSFEEAARRDEYAGYEIIEFTSEGRPVRAGEREEYFPVRFAEATNLDDTTLGFDHATDLVRWTGMVRARDSAKTVAVLLPAPPPGSSSPSILAFVPVYRPGFESTPGSSIEARRDALRGFLVGRFDVEKLLAPLAEEFGKRQIRFRLSDATPGEEARVLLDTLPETVAVPADWIRAVSFADRLFRVDMEPALVFWKAGYTKQARIFLVFAVVAAFMVSMSVLASSGRKAAISSEVALRTTELSREIDARRATESALRESEQDLAITLNSIGDAVMATDIERRITRMNPVAERLTGWPRAEAIGKPVEEMFRIIDEVTRQPAHIPVDAVLRTGEVHGLANHTVLVARDGTERLIADSAAPIRDADGGLRGVVLVFRDQTAERRAQAELRAKSEELDRYFTRSLDLLCIADSEGMFRRLNPEWENTLGYALSELEGHRFLDFVHPDDIAATQVAMKALAQGREVVGFVNRYCHKDGSHRFLEWRAHAERGLIYAAARDITTQREAEEEIRRLNVELERRVEQRTSELAESERFNRATLDALAVHVAVLDARGAILTTNRAWREFAQANNSSLQNVSEGANYLEVCDRAASVGDADAAAAARGIREVIEGSRQLWMREYPCHSPAEQRWFCCRVTRFAGDGPVRVVVAHEDISPMKSAQEQAHHSEKRFSDLFEFAPDAIVIANREGRIIQANRQAERMFGWSREELAGQPIEILEPREGRDDRARLRQEVLGSASTKTPSFGRPDLRAQRKDGTMFPMSINLSPLDAAEGVLVAAFVRDTSERVQAERYARRSQRLEAIGTLAGGVAHDVNNALAPILMVVEMLRMQYPAESELLDTLQASAKRGADMVRQLLTFAKGAEGDRVSVQIKHLLKEMAKIIKGTFPKNIHLDFKYAQNLPTVMGDATQLHQVLLNLCVNARDAMPNGGSLTLEAHRVDVDAAFASATPDAVPGRYVALQVRDTGDGIPPDVIERIFDPFFTTKGPEKGSGLGLSTVMGIVKGHGGFIQVYSKPGLGSTFKVYLPAEDVVSTTEFIRKAPAELRGQGQLLLFVDDEASVRDAARNVLRALDFKVETATDGADALIKAVEHREDLHAVITDLHMPQMDGVAFIRALRRFLPKVPVIIASGRLEDSTTNELKALDVCVRLDKPFTQNQLAEALKAALSGQSNMSGQPPPTH